MKRARDGKTWTIMRQDDHGNRFVVRSCLSREEAQRQIAEFEAREHKQTYWMEPEVAVGFVPRRSP